MSAIRKDAYSGMMTPGSCKRLSKAISLMCQAYKARWIYNPVTQRMQYHHISYITLTVSSRKNITRSFAQEHLLKHFLQWMRRTLKVKAYVSKAELQEREQIHYHIVTPDFIPYDQIRKKWNALQRKAGLLNEYAKEHGHFNPNSTDIHSIKKIKKIGPYIIKELVKSVSALEVKIIAEVDKDIQAGNLIEEYRQVAAEVDTEIRNGTLTDQFRVEIIMERVRKRVIKQRLKERVRIDGKTWDASDNLTSANYFVCPMTEQHMIIIEQWQQSGVLSIKSGENNFYHIVTFNDKSPPDLLDENEKQNLCSHLAAILN